MKHAEFREQLMQSLLETAKDSLAKREATSNPLAYVIHNTQVELLRAQIQWGVGQKTDPCCTPSGQVPPDMQVPE
jgi:hypothetical protein